MAMNNSLAEVHPELITEWSEKNLPLTPDDITFGSNKKVWWKGTCGHEWQASVKARSGGENCPFQFDIFRFFSFRCIHNRTYINRLCIKPQYLFSIPPADGRPFIQPASLHR